MSRFSDSVRPCMSGSLVWKSEPMAGTRPVHRMRLPLTCSTCSPLLTHVQQGVAMFASGSCMLRLIKVVWRPASEGQGEVVLPLTFYDARFCASHVMGRCRVCKFVIWPVHQPHAAGRKYKAASFVLVSALHMLQGGTRLPPKVVWRPALGD